MPFRCKCGRTFEKVESFGSHTSGCAPFHHRRTSTSDVLLSSSHRPTTTNTKEDHKKPLSIQTTQAYVAHNNQSESLLSFLLSPILGQKRYPSSSTSPLIETSTSTLYSASLYEFNGGFMMPTALSIQNTFEGVKKRRSMSYSNSSATQHPAATFQG